MTPEQLKYLADEVRANGPHMITLRCTPEFRAAVSQHAAKLGVSNNIFGLAAIRHLMQEGQPATSFDEVAARFSE